MAGSYAYTPDIWPPLVVALCVAALGWYSWRRDRVPARGLSPSLVCFGPFGS